MDPRQSKHSTDSIHVSELHDYYAYWIHRLSGAILQKFERALAEKGVTHAQWYVLITVHAGHADTPRTIAKFIEIDTASVSRVIDRLVAKGLLTKRPRAEDRRSVHLNLNDEGKAIIASLASIADLQEGMWRSCLSDEETKVLASVLKKLLLAQGLSPSGSIWGLPDHHLKPQRSPPLRTSGNPGPNRLDLSSNPAFGNTRHAGQQAPI